MNNIKSEWKTETQNDIRIYSESELNDIVVKSAKKSIKAIYPGNIFRLIIIGVIVFISVRLIIRQQSPGIMLTDLSGLLILSVSYFFWERSAYIMRRYNNNIPVKQWLEKRIAKIEKSIRFNTKYDWALYITALLIAGVFYVIYQVLTDAPANIINVVVVPAGLVVYFLIVRHFLNKNYRKTLESLKELYRQFEE